VPLNQRLRDALQRSSLVVSPDVRRNLRAVRRRTRVVIIRRRIVSTLAAAAVVGVTVFVAPHVLDFIQSQRETPAFHPPSPTAVAPGRLVGAYLNYGGALARVNLNGPWFLEFKEDGSIVWNPPAGAGIAESLPRDTYQMVGNRIVTDLFRNNLCRGKGIGTYSWRRSGGPLTFGFVDDACAARRAVLTSASWTAG
jgi:hypothetical protein